MIDTEIEPPCQRWDTLSHRDHGKKARVWNPTPGDIDGEYTGVIRCRFGSAVPMLVTDSGHIVRAFAWFYMVQLYE